MENEVSFDLEEGEILEYDFDPPKPSKHNYEALGTGKDSALVREVFNDEINSKRDDYPGVPGFVGDRWRKRLKLSDRETHYNQSSDTNYDVMLNLTSLDEEERIHLFHKRRHLNHCDRKKSRHRKNYSGSTHGTVEDIMCQIDQMVCKGSHYNRERRRQAREIKQSWEKFYEARKCSYNARAQDVICDYYTGVRRSKRQSECKICVNIKHPERLSRQKKRVRVCSNHSSGSSDERSCDLKDTKTKSKYVGDFDEVRRNLLEKLKKKQESMKEEPKNLDKTAIQESDNIEIVNGEVLVESVNCMSSSSQEVIENSEIGETKHDSKVQSESAILGAESEMDLAQLRLIALASNKKKKNLENFINGSLTTTNVGNTLNNTESCDSERKSVEDEYTETESKSDLDRNELLLRAEALKTALLKKHQKRLNRLKTSKEGIQGSSSDTDNVSSYTIDSSENKTKGDSIKTNDTDLKQTQDSGFSFGKTGDECRESEMDFTKRETGFSSTGLKELPGNLKQNVEPLVPDISLVKRLRMRSKKKKKKMVVLNNVKKNGRENNQPLEEDCCNLRNQLLCDLIKKKSLKFLEKKSILLDSMQKSAIKPLLKNQHQTATDVKVPASVTNAVKARAPVQTGKLAGQPKIPKPEIERIIVHLGSDDSSDGETVECSKTKECTPQVPTDTNSSENNSAQTQVPEQTKPIDEAILSCYEEKVMLLLGQTRRKIDQELLQKAKKKQQLNTAAEAIYRHLPPSQRLEYIRLKQKIAERELEKQKEKANVSPVLPSVVAKDKPLNKCDKTMSTDKSLSESPVSDRISSVVSVPVGTPVSKSDDLTKSVRACNKDGRVSVNSRIDEATGNRRNTSNAKSGIRKTGVLSNGKQNSPRCLPNPVLITKLKFLLKKIKAEKTIEENYDKEITKLKTQMNLLERKRSEQRFKIKKLAEESEKTYELIQNGSSVKLQIKEDSVKAAAALADIKEEKSKSSRAVEKWNEESTVEAEPQIGINEQGKSASEVDRLPFTDSSPKTPIATIHYSSPLEAFGQGSLNSEKVDPNVVMCQFDITGKCRDKECVYQHLKTT